MAVAILNLRRQDRATLVIVLVRMPVYHFSVIQDCWLSSLHERMQEVNRHPKRCSSRAGGCNPYPHPLPVSSGRFLAVGLERGLSQTSGVDGSSGMGVDAVDRAA